ncbi:MAG: alanine racemase [Tissierellales bacterium]|jgi:alanine racemase|nr:alanine racemase [Tissierellales bacterium]MBN2826846.1 alanine racemase [Tissierellales bacterium]
MLYNEEAVMHRPAWIEVNMAYLAHNFLEVKRVISPTTKICAVVKADGYKLGAVKVAEIYIKNGADMLAVAILGEAIELRRKFPTIPILVLGYTPDELFNEALAHEITLTIFSEKQGVSFDNECSKMSKIGRIHIKLDTGMNRLGFLPNDNSVKSILKLSKLLNIEIEGIYTHLAKADEKDKTYSYQQKHIFDQFYLRLSSEKLMIPIRHLSNSAAIIDLPDFNYEMVRPGIMLTGLYPSKEINREKVELKQAFMLKTQIGYVKKLASHEGISYGHQYVTSQETLVGTLPIGYADGISRLLSEKLYVMIHGIKCDVLGRICMDQCMVDLTDVTNPKIGDEVIIYDDGTSGGLIPDDIAELLKTVNYEVMTMLDRRLTRVYR